MNDFSPVLLLLPVLVLSGTCTQTVPPTIATDDRPASPQPAIASPVPNPLTIESLAGIYKGAIDEQELTEVREVWREDGGDDSLIERYTRQIFESRKITIHADSTFERQEDTERKEYGKVWLYGNELIFTTELIELDNSTKVSKCPEHCTLYLYVTADGKTLLPYDPQVYGSQKPILPFLHGYVKQ